MGSNKNLLYGGILILIIVIAGIYIFDLTRDSKKNSIETVGLSPEEVITLYFESWDKKDYATMYPLFSDGFKKIEPTAKTLNSFENYASSQNVDSIKVNSLTEKFTDESTSVIDYSVMFILNDGSQIPFNSEFTLRYRNNDKVPGWKMIHPYGDNVDTS